MKTIACDSSTIISLSSNCLLWVLEALKRSRGASFVIPSGVFRESVVAPEGIEKYELNALRLKEALAEGVISVERNSKEVDSTAVKILELANNAFTVKGKPITILHRGEAEAMALVGVTDADIFAVDERTARNLLEAPEAIRKSLEESLRQKVALNSYSIGKIRDLVGDVTIVRSVDLVSYAHSLGVAGMESVDPREFLRAALYALKFSGCAVSLEEIREHVAVGARA